MEEDEEVGEWIKGIFRKEDLGFDWQRLREVIARYKEEPIELIARKYEKTDLIGIGEIHSSQRGHRFVRELLSPLRDRARLEHISLELENKFQEHLDEYLRTGNEEHLRKIIEREAELVKRGYPVEGRVNGCYFDIIREARRLGLKVFLVDDDYDKDDDNQPFETVERRNRFMAEHLPREGQGVFYCGMLHQADIKNLLGNRMNILDLVDEELGRDMTKAFFHGDSKPFGIDVKNERVWDVLSEHLYFELFYRHFDGIACIPK